MEKFCGVYKITSPSNKVYIGSSIDINDRFKQYKRLYNCKPQVKLYNSLNKYGVENHIFEILFLCEKQDRFYFERCFGDIYNSIKCGLNCQLPGRDDLPQVFSEETRAKFSANTKGDKNAMYGKTHTKQSRDKIRENRKEYLKTTMKSVFQYDLEGNLLKVFESVNAAARETGIDCGSICICCNKKIKQIRNFVFRYENDEFSYIKPTYKHLSTEEKDKIQKLLLEGQDVNYIANLLNRSYRAVKIYKSKII